MSSYFVQLRIAKVNVELTVVRTQHLGIVHAGVGNGNIHQNLFPMLEKARQQGILVVRSSRVPTGTDHIGC